MQERVWQVVMALVVCTVIAVPAAAQDEPPEERPAQDRSEELSQLVHDASAAYGAGEFETAVDKLLQAYRIEPNARLLYNVARSYEELGQCRVALVYYRSFSRHEGAEAALVKNATEKLSKSDRCEDYTADLTGRIVIASNPAGATVTIDGREVGVTPAEVAGLPSGEHTISVALDGYKPASNTLTLAAGRDREINATLVEAGGAEAMSSEDLTGESGDRAGADRVGEPSAPADPDAPGVSIPAVALVGAGVVGLGVGAYFDLVAIPDTDAERSGHASGSQAYADLTETRSNQATGALIGYIGGGALLAAGTTWLLLDLSGTTSEEATSLRPITSPRKGGFVAGVAWEF